MSDEHPYKDMPLTAILKEWMDLNEWSDPIAIDKDRRCSQVATRYVIKDQPYRLYFDIDEPSQMFMVTLYTAFNVPAARMAEMTCILNRINCKLRLGKFTCNDEGENNPVSFSVGIDAEGSTLSTAQVDNMLGMSGAAIHRYAELLAAIALTKQTVQAAWKELLDHDAHDKTQTGAAVRSLH